jgi:hypothetical protein
MPTPQELGFGDPILPSAGTGESLSPEDMGFGPPLRAKDTAKAKAPASRKNTDYYSDLQSTFPKANFTSGFRTAEYQEDMKRRGYKPAANSKHLDGDSIDIADFGGLSLSQGAAALRRKYPEASIMYGDKNHKDHVHVTFPGYGKFPAFGGAYEAGINNPIYGNENDFGDPIPAQEFAAQQQKEGMEQGAAGGGLRAGIVAPEMRGGVPLGTEITFEDQNDQSGWDRDAWLKTNYNMDANTEATITAFWNQNKGNPNITRDDIQAFYGTLGTSADPNWLTDEKMAQFHAGQVNYGGFDDTADKEAYFKELQAINDAKDAELVAKGEDPMGSMSNQTGSELIAGIGDEARGADAALLALLQGEGFGAAKEEYLLNRDASRYRLDQDSKENGMAGEIGAMIATLPSAAFFPGALAKSIRGMAGAGAKYGALWGATHGEGLEDTIKQMGIGAATGAVLDPLFGKTIQYAGKAIGNTLPFAKAKDWARYNTGEEIAVALENGTSKSQVIKALRVHGMKKKDATDFVDDIKMAIDNGYVPKPIREGADMPPAASAGDKLDPTIPAKELDAAVAKQADSVVDDVVEPDVKPTVRMKPTLDDVVDPKVKPTVHMKPTAADGNPIPPKAAKAAGLDPDAKPPPMTPREKAKLTKEQKIAAEAARWETADLPAAQAKLVKELQKTIPYRAEQKRIQAEINRRQTAEISGAMEEDHGPGGFFKAMSLLNSGKTRKVSAASIVDKFTDDDLWTLYASLRHNPAFRLPNGQVRQWDIFNTSRALDRVLGAEGMGIPTEGDMKLLQKAFGKQVSSNLRKLQPLRNRSKDLATNLLNLPRAIMSTIDLSGLLRQGLFTIRRKEFWKNWSTMFKAFGSEKMYQGIRDDLDMRVNRELYEKYGLATTDPDGPLAGMEEDFMTNWAEKIPGFGRLARMSNRAFSAFLSKLRADVFDDVLIKMTRFDPDFIDDPKRMKALAGYVNNATGRGNLGSFLERSAPALNAAFFSPRLIASRVQLLNPVYYLMLPKGLRAEAAKDLLAVGGLATTLLGLADLAGAEVEYDPRSTNFAKIKIGDTRYDILGGFQQYIRLYATISPEFMGGGSKKYASGEVHKLEDARVGDKSRADVIAKFRRSKMSPVWSYFEDMMNGSDFLGDDFHAGKGILSRMVPMFIGDVIEAQQEEGALGVLKATPSFFGISSTTYPTPKDEFGNTVVTGGIQGDPVYDELKKIGQLSEVIGSPSSVVDKVKVDDESYEKYKELAGKYTYDDIKEEIASPGWSDLSNEEKIGVIKDIKKYARKDARADLEGELTPAESDEPVDSNSPESLGFGEALTPEELGFGPALPPQ